MATVTKTWNFVADAEGFVDVGISDIVFQKDAGDASVHFIGVSAGTGVQEKARSPTGQTWETWGVPAGATVTDVQITGWSRRKWNFSSGSAPGALALRVVDSGGTTVHSAGDLATNTLTAGSDSDWVPLGAGTSRAVDSGKQASNTLVRFEIQFDIAASGGANNDVGLDSIQLTITYTPSGGGGSPQFARPDSTVTTNTWVANIGGSLFAAIDEVTASDSDYIENNNNTNDGCEVGLSDVTDPGLSTGHVLRARYAKSASGGNSRNITVSLYQGATLIAEFTENNILDTFTDNALSLTGTQADAITDYSDLRVRIAATGTTGGSGGNRRSVRVSWVELEVPAVPASNPPGPIIKSLRSRSASRFLVRR